MKEHIMKKSLLFTAVLFTLGALYACPGHESFQAATGTAVNAPRAKKFNPSVDVTNGTDMNYDDTNMTSGSDINDMNMDMDYDEMTQGDMDME